MEELRLNILKELPEPYNAMRKLEEAVVKSGLDEGLYELIKMRASQINGCAHCINLHSKAAIKKGETAQRLFLLDAWEETELYSEKERAVIALTESLTKISSARLTDEVYETAAKHLDKKELSVAIMAIVAINSWNRISIATKLPIHFAKMPSE